MTDQRTLRQLLDELRDTTRQLTEHTERLIVRDDGSITRHPHPSLLQQLRDARHHGGENGSGGRTQEPLRLAALDLLQQITADADALARAADAMARGSTVESHIRTITRAAGQWTDTQPVRTALQHLTQWRDDINDLLDPPRRMEIVAPCPACGVRMVWRHKDGEDVQVAALTVDGTKGCHCLACHHVWPPHLLEHLALVIGCEPVGDTPESNPVGHDG